VRKGNRREGIGETGYQSHLTIFLRYHSGNIFHLSRHKDIADYGFSAQIAAQSYVIIEKSIYLRYFWDFTLAIYGGRKQASESADLP
jgi:hypothetical protein